MSDQGKSSKPHKSSTRLGADSRREFVKSSSAGGAGLLILQPQTVFGSQANSALTLGVIGYGGRATHVTGIFTKNEFLRVAAVCDIYDDRLQAASKKFSGAKLFKDYQQLLATDVDAVYIATPAYLHPEHFEAAVNARKHIFMEKPIGVDAPGCLRVLSAARRADKSKRISVDFQQRYGKDYNRAFEILQSGELGSLRMVRAAWIGGGPAIRTGHPADQERIRNWFFYRELSGDILIEQDCHNIDVVNWFAGEHPVRVSGYGSRQMRTYGNVFDSLACSFQFGTGLIFDYSANQFGRTTGYSDVSETFICENGTINTSRRGYTILREGKPPEEVKTTYDITQDAVGQFIEGARTGKIENMAIPGAISTLTAVMALQACVQGKEMTWDEINRV